MSKVKDGELLIIFYKNPQLGKVKTRLAATVGEAKAFSIYLLLSEHTRIITESLPVKKAIFYSDYIDNEDSWPNELYEKYLQCGDNLGEKMENAFAAGFKGGYKSICIIGTDCLELTSNIVHNAFRKLLTNDVVIGPAKDGGYYLLGMNYLQHALFRNKKWSSTTVLSETLNDLKMLGLNFQQLEPLSDVDEEKDLPNHFEI